MWVLSPMFLAIAIAGPQAGLFQRDFRFATLARVSISGNLAATFVGVSAAVAGAGYWSLIIQPSWFPFGLALPFGSSATIVLGCGSRAKRFRALFRISRHFMGDRLMTFLSEQTDKAAIGRELGAGDPRGLRRRVSPDLCHARRTGDFGPSRRPACVFACAGGQEAPGERLPDAIRTFTTVSLPIFVVVGVTAHDLVLVVFGAKWLAAVPAMQVFCAYGAVQAFLTYNTVFLQAVGFARTVFWLASVGTLLQIAMVALAVPMAPRGLPRHSSCVRA